MPLCSHRGAVKIMANCQKKQEVLKNDLEKLPKVSLPNVEPQEMDREQVLKSSGSSIALFTKKRGLHFNIPRTRFFFPEQATVGCSSNHHRNKSGKA